MWRQGAETRTTPHGHGKDLSILACLRACVPACLHTCMPACLHACMLAYLHACIPASAAVVDSQIKDLCVGAVLKGIITNVKPYGAFVDVGGMSGLLHISQISCDHISNVESVIPVGTEIKCMVISQDKGKGRVALSTKTLEEEPGDMINAQAKVFENAEATAAKYQARIEAERKAREEAAQDVIFGLESVFSDSAAEPATEPAAEPAAEPAKADDLPFEG